MIKGYEDFLRVLRQAGFSMGGGNSEGIFSVVPWGWEQTPPYETKVAWHTGDPETDPWEWRMRVLDEATDIGYGKYFFKKSGYITREWMPYFLAVRRGSSAVDTLYEEGALSREAKALYDLIEREGPLPLHALKALGGFDSTNKSRFDSALTALQMGLMITMCGRQQKLSQSGEAYGWSSTVFCTTEAFWPEAVFQEAQGLEAQAAYEAIKGQILKLNPDASSKKIDKFIRG